MPAARGLAGARGEHDGVELLAQVLDGEVIADVDAAADLDALLLEHLHAAVDHPLLELGVRDPEAQQAARGLVLLEDDDRVAGVVELLGGGEAGRAAADDGDAAARALLGDDGDDPALLPGVVDDRVLDLLDHHRVVVDGQHAGGLARRRADQAGELGEVVGGVQLVDRLAPAAAIDEVVPVGDQVAEGAAVVAEGDAAVHAATALLLELLVGEDAEDLLVVGHALTRVALRHRHTMDLQEASGVAHAKSGYAPPVPT